jgi:hypothetical protein
MCRLSARRLSIKNSSKGFLTAQKGLPDEIADSTQNPKKIIGTPNQPIRTNF